jgi:hypothetical protein
MQAAGFRQPFYRLLLSPEDAQASYWTVDKGGLAILVCD